MLQSAGRSTLSSLACIQTCGGKCIPWPRSLCPDPNWASSAHFGRACVTRSSRYLGFTASYGFWNNNCLPICFYLYVPLIAFISTVTKLFAVLFVAWFLPQKFVLQAGLRLAWGGGRMSFRIQHWAHGTSSPLWGLGNPTRQQPNLRLGNKMQQVTGQPLVIWVLAIWCHFGTNPTHRPSSMGLLVRDRQNFEPVCTAGQDITWYNIFF